MSVGLLQRELEVGHEHVLLLHREDERRDKTHGLPVGHIDQDVVVEHELLDGCRGGLVLQFDTNQESLSADLLDLGGLEGLELLHPLLGYAVDVVQDAAAVDDVDDGTNEGCCGV